MSRGFFKLVIKFKEEPDMNIYETVVKYCTDNKISIFEFEK
jgi:hypothetical protein